MIRGLHVLQVDLTDGTDKHDEENIAKAKAVYATAGLTGMRFYYNLWGDIEPSPGVFDWSNFDDTLKLLPPGFGLVVSITGGLKAPSWLWEQDSVPTVAVTVNIVPHGPNVPVTVPAQWSDRYLELYLGAYRAFAAHIADLVAAGTIQANQVNGVVASLFHGIDSEMCLPCNAGKDTTTSAANAEAYADAGYTPSTALAGWSWALDELADIFPDCDLLIPTSGPATALPPVDETGNVVANGDTTTDQLAYYEHAGETYGRRALTMDTSAATQAESSFFVAAVAAGCRMSAQTNAWGAGGGTASGDHANQGPVSADGLAAVLANAIGWCAPNPPYIEVHPSNCTQFPAVITSVAAKIAGGD